MMQGLPLQVQNLSRSTHTCISSVAVPFRRRSLLSCNRQEGRAHFVQGVVSRKQRRSRPSFACSQRDSQTAETSPAIADTPRERPSWMSDLTAIAGGALLIGIALLSWTRPAYARSRYVAAGAHTIRQKHGKQILLPGLDMSSLSISPFCLFWVLRLAYTALRFHETSWLQGWRRRDAGQRSGCQNGPGG